MASFGELAPVLKWRHASPLALALVSVLGCNSVEQPSPERPPDTAPTASALAERTSNVASTASAHPEASAGSGHTEDCTPEDGHREHLPAPKSLTRQDREALTRLSVTAHVGAVIIRKQQDGQWKTAGPKGCVVPPSRMSKALDGLVALKLTPTTGSIPVGARFELQVDALVDQRRAVHLEVAEASGDRDFVRLTDDSTATVKRLSRELWSTDPLAWCRDF